MIHDQDIPMYLWEEAARTIVYVHNRISHSVLGDQTPKEMFSGENPEVSDLKIFGCSIEKFKVRSFRKEGIVCRI